jgi:hypothetical protein
VEEVVVVEDLGQLVEEADREFQLVVEEGLLVAQDCPFWIPVAEAYAHVQVVPMVLPTSWGRAMGIDWNHKEAFLEASFRKASSHHPSYPEA